MTEQEMNKLADIIVNKIIEKQSEYDSAFVNNLNKEYESTFWFPSHDLVFLFYIFFSLLL